MDAFQGDGLTMYANMNPTLRQRCEKDILRDALDINEQENLTANNSCLQVRVRGASGAELTVGRLTSIEQVPAHLRNELAHISLAGLPRWRLKGLDLGLGAPGFIVSQV
jgi:hypothetical protein